MCRRLFGAWIIAAAALALPAHADIMYWYWQVEVNGETADASKPIVVGAGDEVEIELWAEWEPRGAGFAASAFSISVGDQFFQVASSVDISEDRGLGRNPSLSALSDENGMFVDTLNSGTFDQIDIIYAAQLAPFYGLFDDSYPMRVYSVEWILSQDLGDAVRLERTNPFSVNAERYQLIYTDIWGNIAEYEHNEDTLMFVPTPPSLLVLAYCLPLSRRRA